MSEVEPLLRRAEVTEVDASALAASSPWRDGRNDAALERGVEFTVEEVESVADLHGDPTRARLVVYLGGNYFFVLPELVAAFSRRHPDLAGRVFYETLPPEIVVRQLEARGVLSVGNLTLSAPPDVLHAGRERVEDLVAEGTLEGEPVLLGTTGLAIMVRRGNPSAIRSLQDLARPGLRLANPDPETEGIARQIRGALRSAGGPELERTVYETKASRGEAVTTRIHHRQTPLWIMQGKVDAGVTWRTEALFQIARGRPIDMVEIPEKHDQRGTSAAALVRGAAHPDEARLWLEFLASHESRAIFGHHGFQPAGAAGAGATPAAAEEKPRRPAEPSRSARPRAVFHLDVADVSLQENALGNVTNARKELGEASEIEVVVHGDAIALVLRESSAHADDIAALRSQGVRVVACENTMRKHGITREQLLEGVETVPSGVAELVRRQQQGFAYVRP